MLGRNVYTGYTIRGIFFMTLTMRCYIIWIPVPKLHGNKSVQLGANVASPGAIHLDPPYDILTIGPIVISVRYILVDVFLEEDPAAATAIRLRRPNFRILHLEVDTTL